MRILFLIFTLLVHMLLVVTIKLTGYFYWVIGVVLLSMLIGFILKQKSAAQRSKDLGWGMFYGSIISLSLLILSLVGILWVFSGMHC